MHEEQDDDENHGRLGDVVVLEAPGQPVEAACAEQYGTHQDHVSPHEYRETQAACAADQLVNELAACFFGAYVQGIVRHPFPAPNASAAPR